MRAALVQLATLAMIMYPPAAIGACVPDALGVSRVIEINRHKGTAVGLQTYPRTLDLADHELVLTFDDGPAGPTGKVLDALAKECARATFFMIGSNAEHMGAVVKRAADEGHSIGSHTYSHSAKTMRGLEEGAAKADIEKGMAAVTKAAGGAAAPFFRFPGFADTPELNAWLNQRGVTIFGSDIWASDWETMTPKAELALLLSRVEKAGKGVVLMHDLKSYTAAMLPDFLRELKKRGFRLVHIVPGESETPVAAAGPGWKSTTEAILAKSLKKKAAKAAGDAPHTHDAGAPEGHDHPAGDAPEPDPAQ